MLDTRTAYESALDTGTLYRYKNRFMQFLSVSNIKTALPQAAVTHHVYLLDISILSPYNEEKRREIHVNKSSIAAAFRL